MRRVLLTHADETIGRRLVKQLVHDPAIEALFLTGRGPTPRAFDAYLSGDQPAVHYGRAKLGRHRSASDLFHSQRFREAHIDTVVHLPPHDTTSPAASQWAGLPELTSETRLVLQHCLETRSVKSLIVLGSAYVYRLHPGNSNRLTEDSELDLDASVAPEIRAWIDSDMTVHGEVHNDRLRVVLLRAPIVVAPGGELLLSPLLDSARPHVRALGFDPLCPVISHKDLARALQAAVHSKRSGIYNVSGREVVPLSSLARWTGHADWAVPGALLRAFGGGAKRLGAGWRQVPYSGPALRYGMSLDTRRAERELGFEPLDRIGASPARDGKLRIEATPAG